MSATIHTLQHPPQAANDAPTPDGVCGRYLEAVVRMHDAAIERRELEACVDALAYGLAWVVFSLERMDVTADVLSKFARHLQQLDMERRTGPAMPSSCDDAGTHA